MNINKKIESSLKSKISDWELDFYSRPIIESNGKKRWELIICSTKSYKTTDIFPIQQDLEDNNLVPGLRLFSKDRSLALSAWFSCLEPIKLVVNKNPVSYTHLTLPTILPV